MKSISFGQTRNVVDKLSRNHFGDVVLIGLVFAFLSAGFLMLVKLIVNGNEITNMTDYMSGYTLEVVKKLKISGMNFNYYPNPTKDVLLGLFTIVYDIIIVGPITVGIAASALAVSERGDWSLSRLFDGFLHTGKSIAMCILAAIYTSWHFILLTFLLFLVAIVAIASPSQGTGALLVLTALLFIPGVVYAIYKKYKIILWPFIIADSREDVSNLSCGEILRRAKNISRGNRGTLFVTSLVYNLIVVGISLIFSLLYFFLGFLGSDFLIALLSIIVTLLLAGIAQVYINLHYGVMYKELTSEGGTIASDGEDGYYINRENFRQEGESNTNQNVNGSQDQIFQSTKTDEGAVVTPIHMAYRVDLGQTKAKEDDAPSEQNTNIESADTPEVQSDKPEAIGSNVNVDSETPKRDELQEDVKPQDGEEE